MTIESLAQLNNINANPEVNNLCSELGTFDGKVIGYRDQEPSESCSIIGVVKLQSGDKVFEKNINIPRDFKTADQEKLVRSVNAITEHAKSALMSAGRASDAESVKNIPTAREAYQKLANDGSMLKFRQFNNSRGYREIRFVTK